MDFRLRNSIILAITALLIAGSFWIIFRYGVNVPHWDDHAVRAFTQSFQMTKFGDLLAFHNEHRIGFTRIIALITAAFHGSLDFKVMMYIGQFGLVLTFGWLIFWLIRLNYPLFWVLVPALLIFNVSTFENSLWAMASLQNHWVLFWILSSLSVLILSVEPEKKSSQGLFVLSIVFSIIAHFTAGNGVMLLPAGALLLQAAGRWRYLGIWILFHALFYLLYFQGFERFGMSQRPHLEQFLINLFDLSGSLLYPLLNKDISTKIPLMAGVLQLLFTLRVFVKVFFRKDNREEMLVYLALMSFFWGSLILIAAGRSDYDQLVLLSSKYKIYSFLIFSVNSICFFGAAQNSNLIKRVVPVAFVSLLLFFNAQISYLDDVNNLHRDRLAELVNLKLSGDQISGYIAPELDFERVLYSEDPIKDKAEAVLFNTAQDKLLIEAVIPEVNADYYAWFVSEGHREIVALHGMNVLFGPSDFRKGSLILFNYPTGNYRVYLLEVSEKSSRLIDPNQEILIRGTVYSNPKKNW